MRTPAVDRALARVEVGDCWLWQGALDTSGYGTIKGDNGKNRSVHRVVWEALVGRVPAGKQLDHHCRVRHCCNPDHLEPVTPKENHRRGKQVAATTCRHGHPFDGVTGTKRPQRTCSICRRARYQRWLDAQT